MTKRIYWSCSRRLLKAWVRWIYLSWWRRLEDVLKTYEQDEHIGLDQDVFRRRMSKTNIFVLKTSSEDEDERRLQDFFKTPSSRWMFAGLLSTRRKTSLLFINSIIWPYRLSKSKEESCRPSILQFFLVCLKRNDSQTFKSSNCYRTFSHVSLQLRSLNVFYSM